MRIREAKQDDLPAIAKLMQKTFSKHPYDEGASHKDIQESLSFYMGVGQAFVATEEEIVGVIVLKTERWWQGTVVLIEDLAVRETHQRKGIGKELLKQAEDHAYEIGAESVRLITDKRAYAMRFYERQGYEEDQEKAFLKKQLQ